MRSTRFGARGALLLCAGALGASMASDLSRPFYLPSPAPLAASVAGLEPAPQGVSAFSPLGIFDHNAMSRAQGLERAPSRWLLVGPVSLRVSNQAAQAAPEVSSFLSSGDSLNYVGMQVEAVRGFQAEFRVFDNLGQFVNGLSFSVPSSEFLNLPLTPGGRSRRLTVLWDNRSEDGRLVGTGSYVLKSKVTLEPLPGRPAEVVSRTQYRRFGVLRNF